MPRAAMVSARSKHEMGQGAEDGAGRWCRTANDTVRSCLAGRATHIIKAPDLDEASGVLCEHPVHLLVVDGDLPDLDSIELVRTARSMSPGMPAVALCGLVDSDLYHELVRELGSEGVMSKTVSPSRFTDVVSRLLAGSNSPM
jgi:DNA-binding response OmpR family regulator